MNKKYLSIFLPISLLINISPVMAQPSGTATIYGTSFYPSDYIPEMMIYARDVESGKTYSFLNRGEEKYTLKLPAPATYIFFSWTVDEIGGKYINRKLIPIKMGAILSKCDGSGISICEGRNNHMPIPIKLTAGQVVTDFKIADYYYPSDETYLYVPLP